MRLFKDSYSSQLSIKPLGNSTSMRRRRSRRFNGSGIDLCTSACSNERPRWVFWVPSLGSDSDSAAHKDDDCMLMKDEAATKRHTQYTQNISDHVMIKPSQLLCAYGKIGLAGRPSYDNDCSMACIINGWMNVLRKCRTTQYITHIT